MEKEYLLLGRFLTGTMIELEVSDKMQVSQLKLAITNKCNLKVNQLHLFYET
jgi:hypothetical protein